MPTVVPVHTATPIAISSNKLMGIRTVPSIRVLRAIKCDVGITDILEEEEEKKKGGTWYDYFTRLLPSIRQDGRESPLVSSGG
jgi:hypothetical protein